MVHCYSMFEVISMFFGMEILKAYYSGLLQAKSETGTCA